MKRSQNFSKSEIFKTAWRCFRKYSYKMTFGQCLKWAWKKAWENLKHANASVYSIAFNRKHKGVWKEYDRKLVRRYENVQFGRNDWSIDYVARWLPRFA